VKEHWAKRLRADLELAQRERDDLLAYCLEARMLPPGVWHPTRTITVPARASVHLAAGDTLNIETERP